MNSFLCFCPNTTPWKCFGKISTSASFQCVTLRQGGHLDSEVQTCFCFIYVCICVLVHEDALCSVRPCGCLKQDEVPLPGFDIIRRYLKCRHGVRIWVLLELSLNLFLTPALTVSPTNNANPTPAPSASVKVISCRKSEKPISFRFWAHIFGAKEGSAPPLPGRANGVGLLASCVHVHTWAREVVYGVEIHAVCSPLQPKWLCGPFPSSIAGPTPRRASHPRFFVILHYFVIIVLFFCYLFLLFIYLLFIVYCGNRGKMWRRLTSGEHAFLCFCAGGFENFHLLRDHFSHFGGYFELSLAFFRTKYQRKTHPFCNVANILIPKM